MSFGEVEHLMKSQTLMYLELKTLGSGFTDFPFKAGTNISESTK